MAGRPAKPAALKKLAGNPGKRRIGAEPKFAEGTAMRAPRHLSAVAKREWRRVSGQLLAAGILTVADRTALAAYCQAYANWVEAEKHLQSEGRVMTFASGYQQISPWVNVAKTALAEMRQYMTEFGMTPSSRARVGQKPVETEDPFEAFVRRKLDEEPAR